MGSVCIQMLLFISGDCEFGFYGNNCSLHCGKCAGNQTCHPVTGYCSAGCEQGWKEPFCNAAAQESAFPGETLVICGIVLCFVLFTLCFSVFCFFRYRKRRNMFVMAKAEALEEKLVTDDISIMTYTPIQEEQNDLEQHKYYESQAYESMLRDAINVHVDKFPDIYKKLLSIWNDGKTVLFFAFQSLRSGESIYESIDQTRGQPMDARTLSYKELVSKYQSLSENDHCTSEQGSTVPLKIAEMPFLVSDDGFSKPTFWLSLASYNVTTCVQIGKIWEGFECKYVSDTGGEIALTRRLLQELPEKHDLPMNNNNILNDGNFLKPTIRKDDRISIGGFVIECTAWVESDSITELNITRKSIATGSPSNIKVFNCKFWEECMEVPIDLLSVIDLVVRLNSSVEEGACVMFHCEQAVNKATLLSMVTAILVKMKKMKVVDILGPTQAVRSVIPNAVSSYEQFKFLHDVALLAIQRNSLW